AEPLRAEKPFLGGTSSRAGSSRGMLVIMAKRSRQPLLSTGQTAQKPVPEPQWPAIAAILAAGWLYPALPPALTLCRRWLFPSVVLALLIPTVVSHHTGRHGLNAFFGIAVVGVLTLGLILSVFLLRSGHFC